MILFLNSFWNPFSPFFSTVVWGKTYQNLLSWIPDSSIAFLQSSDCYSQWSKRTPLFLRLSWLNLSPHLLLQQALSIMCKDWSGILFHSTQSLLWSSLCHLHHHLLWFLAVFFAPIKFFVFLAVSKCLILLEVEVLIAQSCPTLCNPMDCSTPGSSFHGVLQARILEWVAIPFSRGSSQSRDRTMVSCTAGGFFTIWATREAPLILLGLCICSI